MADDVILDRPTGVESGARPVRSMRFNHMELTFARGTLTAEVRADIDSFYGEVFGWKFLDTMVVGQMAHLCQLGDSGDFILLAESDKPISSPGYDHLGILMDSRADVDATLAACKARQATDDRVLIKEYADLITPNLTVHAFYVKHLLPIWFDVQCMERHTAT
jgi:predicted enzyme related to lactoylglutathione lyase